MRHLPWSPTIKYGLGPSILCSQSITQVLDKLGSLRAWILLIIRAEHRKWHVDGTPKILWIDLSDVREMFSEDLHTDVWKEAKGDEIDPRGERHLIKEKGVNSHWNKIPSHKRNTHTYMLCHKWIRDKTVGEDSIGNCSLKPPAKLHVLWIPEVWTVGKPSAGSWQHSAGRWEVRLCLHLQSSEESQECGAWEEVHGSYQCSVLKIIELIFVGLVY